MRGKYAAPRRQRRLKSVLIVVLVLLVAYWLLTHAVSGLF
jgi:uncharacterized membrane protein YphA (DoxX/SURF4 family)